MSIVLWYPRMVRISVEPQASSSPNITLEVLKEMMFSGDIDCSSFDPQTVFHQGHLYTIYLLKNAHEFYDLEAEQVSHFARANAASSVRTEADSDDAAVTHANVDGADAVKALPSKSKHRLEDITRAVVARLRSDGSKVTRLHFNEDTGVCTESEIAI
jgi:hypothetical protein